MNARDISIVVAVARGGAIGRGGDLLCHLPADLRHFKEVTMGGIVIMGRKTWESLPKGALPGRRNIVLSSNKEFQAPGAEVVPGIEEALDLIADDARKAFIIGGGMLYAAAIEMAGTIFMTEIDAEFDGADTFFPDVDPLQWETVDVERHLPDEKNRYPFTFKTLVRRRAI